MYTTKEFETALLMMQVKILEMSLTKGFVTRANGIKNGMLLNWDAQGKCFIAGKPCPEYNALFIVVSANKCTLFYGNTPFKFKQRTIFTPKYMCVLCDLKPQCHADHIDGIPFPCYSRPDGKDGYFKKIKA